MKNGADDFGMSPQLSNSEYIFMSVDKSDIYRTAMEAVERPLIEKALERTFGNQAKAAKILGIHRNTLKTKIDKFGICPERWKI